MFVRTERFNVLIDTLATPALCRQALDLLAGQMAGRPLLVVNSHMDWDHFWGNGALDSQVPIIAHGKAIDRLSDPVAREILAEKQQEARFDAVELIAPTITFDGESMVVHGGDLTLELIHTPGHTPDYVVLAHGQTAAPAVVDANLRYFATLRDRVAGLTNTERNDAGLADRDGLRLQDLVTVPRDMSAETRAFYERCHQSNLAAMLAARNAGIDPFREPAND